MFSALNLFKHKTRKASKKFETICIVGLPKCGTTYLLDFFINGNFTNIVHKRKEATNLMNGNRFIKFKHCIAKNPRIIWDIEYWSKQLKYFDDTSEKCLFIVCVRPYNDAIYSLYKYFQKGGSISNNMKYNIFLDSHKKTYLDIEKNIITLKNTVKELVVLRFNESIINENTYKIIEDLNIDFKTLKEKKWGKHTPKKMPEGVFIDEELSLAYQSLLNNPLVNSITYKNKKYLYEVGVLYRFCKIWRSLNC